MKKTYGKNSTGSSGGGQYGKPFTPKPMAPRVVLKLRGEMHPGELAVTLQQACDALDARGMLTAAKVSVYITPLDENGEPVWIKNADGTTCEELFITPYCFVDKEFKI